MSGVLDSLADLDIAKDWAKFEGFQYVASQVYEEMIGKEMPRSHLHPRQPRGKQSNEWEFGKRYPRLAAKYGHRDEDYALEKIRDAEEKRREIKAKKLTRLALDAGLIPTSGLIPPMRILSNALRSGRSPSTSGRDRTWTPIELDEALYWRVVIHLERMRPDDLARWSEMRATALRLDNESGRVETFEAWMESLRSRGLNE